MADTFIYHPGTDATVPVPEESVWHYRQAGWLLRSEWDEQQAQAAKRDAAEAEAAKKPASGSKEK